MSGKRSIRELERQCKKEPDNLVARLLLAAAYREAGRAAEAVPLYRSVASAYQRQGRKTQAVAVLRSLLELDASDGESRSLLQLFDESGPVAVPEPAAVPAGAASPGAAPESGRQTMPSLDGQRLRATGQALSARVISTEIEPRELSPVRPPGVPATRAVAAAEPSPASTLSGLGLAGPGVRAPTPGRGSSALYTPTPLPAPMPFHEVDVTSNHERLVPAATPGGFDEEAATRIADAFRTARPDEPARRRPITVEHARPLPSRSAPRTAPPPMMAPPAAAPPPARAAPGPSAAAGAPRPATPTRPAPVAARPATPTRPAPVAARPATPTRPAPVAARPATPTRPAPVAARPAPPGAQPPAPAPRPAPPRPAPLAAPPTGHAPRSAPTPTRPPVAMTPTSPVAPRRAPTVPPPLSAPSPALSPRRAPTVPPPARRAPIARHDHERTRPTTGTDTNTQRDIDVAAELDTRRVRRLSEHELDLLAEPPPGPTGMIERVDTANDVRHHDRHHGDRDDDADGDLETNPEASPAGELREPLPRARTSSTMPNPTPTPTLLTPARGGRAASGSRPRAATLDDEPTRLPGPRESVTDEIEAPTRVAPDLSQPSDPGDELTRVAPDTQPSLRETPWPHGLEEPTDPRGSDPAQQARVSKPGMHRSKAFPAAFSDTLGQMDPDGAAIETPLDMFSMLPPDALAELERRMILRRFGPGELIVREGDPGDACYVIVDGEVRVLKNDPLHADEGPVEVARLGAGSLFGEFALLADRRRHATVQSTSHTDLYEIPRQLLRELAASFPGVGPALESFYRQRLLATLLRTAPFFAPLPDDQRAQLLARFVPVRAESGEAIVREGLPAGGLYLIVIGAVEITKRLGRHRSVILASLREGAYFGEMSLLSGEPTAATVVAAGRVELALLAPRDFYEIVAQHPQLWAHVRREARTRALETAKILAGETGAV